MPDILRKKNFAFLNCSIFRYHLPDRKTQRGLCALQDLVGGPYIQTMTGSAEMQKFDNIGQKDAASFNGSYL
jgi:hypothetical protein